MKQPAASASTLHTCTTSKSLFLMNHDAENEPYKIHVTEMCQGESGSKNRSIQTHMEFIIA